MKVKVGVIGLGLMGSAHVRVYSRLEGCELVGICDSAGSKKYLAEKYGCKFFERVSDLLKEDLDAISICTPTSTHKEMALKALEKSKDILVEKPLATNVEDADHVIKRAKKSGLLAVGFIERFNPVVTKLRETVDFDDIYSTVSMRFGPGSKRIRDVGVLLDLGSHEIDLLRYLTKAEPEVLYSYVSNDSEGKFENYAYISLKYGQLHSHIETSWLPNYKLRCANLYGNKKFYSVNFAQQKIKTYRAPPKIEINYGNWEDILWLSRNVSEEISISPAEPLELELKCFVKSVKEGEVLDPLCSGQDGLEVLRIIERAIDKSL
jgi:UDP-N-acetylglucosamine 3-dehydrogenase